jgi:hypothetical protein
VSKTNRAGNDLATQLLAMDDSTNAVKGTLIVSRPSDDAQAAFTLGAVTDATDYVKVAVSAHAGSAAFTAADAISLQPYRSGNAGAAGSNGANGADGADPGILLTWDTGTADADPGTGEIRANNASLASATFLYVSKTSRGGSSIATFLATLDDSTNTVKGTITLTRPSDDAQATVDVTALTDAVGYVKLAIQSHSGSTAFTAADAISFQFSRAGNQGSGDLLAANNLSDVANKATAATNLGLGGVADCLNIGLLATVAGNALTIALKGANGSDPSASNPVTIGFRNVTPATGTPVARTATAATSFTVSSGSTLGTTNNVAFRLIVVMIDDGGTLRLGLLNSATGGIVSIDEATLYSSTAEGGAGGADSAGVIYTGTAATSKAIREIGYLDFPSGLATAGTWSAAPTTVQLASAGARRSREAWNKRVVTAGETWTVPAGVTEIEFEAWGAGGSGAGGDSTANQRGSGGGAGGYLRKLVKAPQIDTSYTITIGTGGAAVASAAGGTAGNAGTSTTIVGTKLGTLTAGGGSGGLAGINTGGAGGTSTNGDANISGESGQTSWSTATLPAAFKGGSSPRGGFGGSANVGVPGAVPGGGGACGNHPAASNSGAGARGEVHISDR